MAGIGDLLNPLKGLISGTTETAKYGALDADGTTKIYTAYARLGKVVLDTSDATSELTLAGGNLLAVNKNLIDSYDGLNKQIAALELRNKDINTTFGINSMAAAKLSTTYQKMANAFKVFSGEQAIVYGNSIRKMLPMYKQEGKADEHVRIRLENAEGTDVVHDLRQQIRTESREREAPQQRCLRRDVGEQRVDEL